MQFDHLWSEEKRAKSSPLFPNNGDIPTHTPAWETDLRVEGADIARIPSSGPVVVTANHHSGMLHGSLLAKLLRRVRSDVKVLSYPARYPFLHAHKSRAGSQSLFLQFAETEALAWLREGGMLAISFGHEIFPWQLNPAQKKALSGTNCQCVLFAKPGPARCRFIFAVTTQPWISSPVCGLGSRIHPPLWSLRGRRDGGQRFALEGKYRRTRLPASQMPRRPLSICGGGFSF